MAIVYTGRLNVPNIVCLSSDESAGKVSGAQPGMVIFYTDTAAWKIVKSDQTLADYAVPATFSGTISLGEVTIGQAHTLTDGVGNYALIVESKAGGDVGSASLATLNMLFNGTTWDKARTPSKYKDLNAVDISSIATVWTPAGGKKFRFMGGWFSVNSPCSVLFEDNAGGTTIFRTAMLEANVSYYFNFGNGILSGAAGRVLKATASTGTVTITGTIYGTEE